jgi:TIGR03009 family protein
MRYLWLTLAAVLVAGASLPAQAPPPPAAAPLDPAHNRLDALLLQWQQKMGDMQVLEAQCTRTTFDKTWQNTDVFEGVAKYKRPNLAMLEMHKKGKPEVYEKYLCNGTSLYEYAPQSKVIRVHELPAPKPGQVADDNFLSFLFGMKAEEARRRYELKLVKEDQWYIYLEILPRFPADKADFHKAQLVLLNNSFLPRRLWFEQPNGNEITWDIPRVDSGAAAHVAPADFAPPATLPQGWRLERVPQAATAPRNDVPPRVVRPQQ